MDIENLSRQRNAQILRGAEEVFAAGGYEDHFPNRPETYSGSCA
jgi:hypothetical protein